MLGPQETITACDEMVTDINKWLPVKSSIGKTVEVASLRAVRRKIVPGNPGDGYRLIAEGELIREGDQFLENGEWNECCSSIGNKLGYKGAVFAAVRRPIGETATTPTRDVVLVTFRTDGLPVPRLSCANMADAIENAKAFAAQHPGGTYTVWKAVSSWRAEVSVKEVES